MKKSIPASILAILILLTGCQLPHKGPAYGHEAEFRQQVEASVPVKKWGYKIQDIRFSEDFEKALVVFDAGGKRREVILQDDGFHRYQGHALDLDRQTANRGAKIDDWSQFITVTLPTR